MKIYYDDYIYTGSFDSFSITESEDQPHTLEYSFDFVVRFEHRIDPHIDPDEMVFAPSEVDPDHRLFEPDEVEFTVETEEDDETVATPEELDEIVEEQQALEDIREEFGDDVIGDTVTGLQGLSDEMTEEEFEQLEREAIQRLFGKDPEQLTDIEREAIGMDTDQT